MKELTFSTETREAIYKAQNNYCGVEGCTNKIEDFHHKLSNKKDYQRLFPLYLNSPLNCIGLCRNHHQSKEIFKFNINLDLVRVYEKWLENITKQYYKKGYIESENNKE